MSDARAADMASISNAVSSPAITSAASAEPNTNPIPPAPPLASLLAGRGKATESEKDAAEREQGKQDEFEQKEGNAAGEIAGAVRKTADTASNIVRDAQVTLEGLPQPGSLALPIILLLLLFMALIPVNGYPRIYWLWLVVTQNAVLAGEPSPPTIPVGGGPGPLDGSGSSDAANAPVEEVPVPGMETYRL